MAWVDAVLVNAGALAWAVSIHSTLRLGLIHLDGLVLAHEAWVAVGLVLRAAAACGVLEDIALCIGGAFVAIEAWVHALSVDARLVSGAFGVAAAAQHLTADVWVALEASRTATLGSVLLRVALGGDVAWVSHQTWVNAHPVGTHLVQRTLLIHTASHCNYM